MSGPEFDRLFARHVLHCPPELITHLRAASAIAEKCETWRALITPLEEFTATSPLLRPEMFEQSAASATTAGGILKSLIQVEQDQVERSQDSPRRELQNDFRELRAACSFTKLLVAQLQNPERGQADLRPCLREAAAFYCDCWLARNKETGLSELRQQCELFKLHAS